MLHCLLARLPACVPCIQLRCSLRHVLTRNDLSVPACLLSAVSWAQELESVKEIGPARGSPALRKRLAAAGPQRRLQLLLTVCILALMVAALLQRLLLSLPL